MEGGGWRQDVLEGYFGGMWLRWAVEDVRVEKEAGSE